MPPTEKWIIMVLPYNQWVEKEQNPLKQKASQGFPDILEIAQKSRSGEMPCDNLKFSEIHRRCQAYGCGKCGDRELRDQFHNYPQCATIRAGFVLLQNRKCPMFHD